MMMSRIAGGSRLGADAQMKRKKPVRQQWVAAAAGKLGTESRVGSMGRLMTALSAMVTDVANDDAPQPAAGHPAVAARALRPGATDTARLDRCRLGPHWCGA